MTERAPSVLIPFLRPIEGGPAAGLDPTDEDFIAIVAAAEKTAWEDLEERVVALEGERLLDVRILAFSCYLAWRAEGFRALPAIHEAIALAAGANLEALGPARKKLAHLDVRVAWALATIADDLTYHEKHATPEWAGWTKGLGRALALRVEETRGPARAALVAAGAARAADALGREAAAVDKHVQPFLVEEQAASPPREGGAQGDVPTQATEGLSSHAGGGVPPSGPASGSSTRRPRSQDLGAGGSLVTLGVSPAFVELVRKLEAFEALIAKGKFQKAALVAHDLTETIERFDPRAFFPELFASFGRAVSENIGVLSEHWEERDSLAWKALEQFYRVDLQRFVDG